eukprot:8656177-Lingulodinium_polyedra.AAC.1
MAGEQRGLRRATGHCLRCRNNAARLRNLSNTFAAAHSLRAEGNANISMGNYRIGRGTRRGGGQLE